MNDFILVQVLDEISILEAKSTLVYIFEISEVSLVPYLSIVDSIHINSHQLTTYGKKMIQSRFSQLVNQYFDLPSNALLIQSFLLLFLDSLGKQSSALFNNQSFAESDAKRINQIKRIIHQNIHTRLSIEDLANQLFLTSPYLSKYIKEKLGTSYLRYVSQLRVKLAEKALIETNDSLTSIANQMGFANVNAMITAFRQVHDLTPREYRSRNQEALKKVVRRLVPRPLPS
ncbi:MAG: AraC family transcriptional regulator [Bacillus subtilis]|nr:AraC family transcriptional regulator [Bacillus subtilis]